MKINETKTKLDEAKDLFDKAMAKAVEAVERADFVLKEIKNEMKGEK